MARRRFAVSVLATRGTSQLTATDVHAAIARGISYLNWCGEPDGLSRAIAELGPQRREVVVGWQIHPRDGAGAVLELERALAELGTDYLDIVTFYYVERDDEWQEIIGAGGVWAALDAAHRGAETEVFPLARGLNLPFVASPACGGGSAQSHPSRSWMTGARPTASRTHRCAHCDRVHAHARKFW